MKNKKMFEVRRLYEVVIYVEAEDEQEAQQLYDFYAMDLTIRDADNTAVAYIIKPTGKTKINKK